MRARGREGGFGRRKHRGGTVALRLRLVEAAAAGEVARGQGRVAGELGGGEPEGGAGAGDVGQDLLRRGARGIGLAREPRHGRLLARDAAARGLDGEDQVAVVKPHDDVARAHAVAVAHLDRRDMPGDLARERRHVGADIGIVGAGEEASIGPLAPSRVAGGGEANRHEEEQDQSQAEATAAARQPRRGPSILAARRQGHRLRRCRRRGVL